MFPKHCSRVSVKEVSFPLTEKDIRSNLEGKNAYKKTEFLVLSNSEQWAVVRIIREPHPALFSAIEDVDIISLPSTTYYIEDSNLDVLSATSMYERAEELGAETLVAKGSFEHVSFISKEEPVEVVVFDVIPLEPPKLLDMVKTVLNTGNIPFPVKVIPRLSDLREMAKSCTSQNIMFPCNASQLVSGKRTFFLDQGPVLSDSEMDSICLLGCDLSLRIFNSIYKKEPAFFSMCPKKRAEEEQEERFVLTRCCKIKEGYERTGNILVVPWGSTLREVEDALIDLLPHHV
jgi:hypothetical protein